MKVLHVINTLGAGGAEKLLTEMLPLMKQKGIQSQVFVLSKNHAFFLSTFLEEGIPISFSRSKKLYSFLQIRRIREIAKNGNFDLIHCHLFPAQFWCSIGIPSLGIPLITTEHSTKNRRRKSRIFNWIDEYLYGRFDRIICNSQATKKSLLHWLPKLQTKVTVVRNGVALRNFYEARPYSTETLIGGSPKQSRWILMVSSFSEAKDQATVIRALTMLPVKYHVILVGDGPKRYEIESLVTTLQLTERVHFLGLRNDIPAIMKTVDILVQSSYWEGFGLSAIEGMASGLPVIVSEIPGLADTVRKAALTFPCGNFSALAKIILDLEQSSRYMYYHQKSLNESKHFDITTMVFAYIKNYEQILRESNCCPRIRKFYHAGSSIDSIGNLFHSANRKGNKHTQKGSEA